MSNIIYLMNKEPLSMSKGSLVDIFIHAALAFDDNDFDDGDANPEEAMVCLGNALSWLFPGEEDRNEDFFRAEYVKAYLHFAEKEGWNHTEEHAHEACPWFEYKLRAPESIIRTLAHTWAEKDIMESKAFYNYMKTDITCDCWCRVPRNRTVIVKGRTLCEKCYEKEKRLC